MRIIVRTIKSLPCNFGAHHKCDGKAADERGARWCKCNCHYAS